MHYRIASMRAPGIPLTYASALETLLVLLAPAVPHITEELWQLTGHSGSVHQQSWPAFDPDLASEDLTQVPVTVDGKVREVLSIPVDASEAEAQRAGDRSSPCTAIPGRARGGESSVRSGEDIEYRNSKERSIQMSQSHPQFDYDAVFEVDDHMYFYGNSLTENVKNKNKNVLLSRGKIMLRFTHNSRKASASLIVLLFIVGLLVGGLGVYYINSRAISNLNSQISHLRNQVDHLIESQAYYSSNQTVNVTNQTITLY